MRMLVSVFLAVVGVFMVGRATAQQTRGVPVPIGFMKSEGFLGLDPREQSMYAIGLFDGSMLAPLVQSAGLARLLFPDWKTSLSTSSRDTRATNSQAPGLWNGSRGSNGSNGSMGAL